MTELAQSVPQPQNWKLTISYDGTEFHGWQVQPEKRTVQGELQVALGRITGESPLPQGSGRTDAGVHALAQVASFPLTAPIPPENLLRALNRTLPASIRILQARAVSSTFHARHSAKAKTYEYRVFPEKPTFAESDSATQKALPGKICPPFLFPYVYAYPWSLDVAALEAAACAFVGQHDFLSFAATDPDLSTREGAHPSNSNPLFTSEINHEVQLATKAATAVRTIFSSTWEQQLTADGTLLVYRVRGSGFLHHMVRNLVGTMLDMGRDRLHATQIPAIIAARSRSAAGPTAPARGLFLHSVEYDGAE